MPTSTGYLNQFENDGVYYDLHDTDLRSKIGQANGIAELDANGKVPSGQLPSYVDEVTDAYYADGEMYIVPTYEGYLYEGDFYKDEDHTELITPEADAYYFDKTGEKYYQYSALAYVEVSPPTPITPASDKIYVNIAVDPAEIYRWTGSTYAKMSSGDGGLVLGETAQTAYRGDRGKTAYDHSQDQNRVTSAVSSGLYKFGVTAEGHIASTTAVQKSDITALGIPESDTNDAVTQTNSSDNGEYRILLSNTADNTSRTEGAKKSAQFTANPNTGKLFSTRATHRAYNNALTGTGTTARDDGAAASPHRYVPAIWTFNSGTTATDGDIYTITVPEVGSGYGVWLSINNGTNYYPIAYQSSAALTTHFGTGVVISVTFDADGSVSNIFALDGSDARIATVSGGCFRVLNAFDSGNTNTAVTQTATTANANYEVLFSVTADNTTRTEGARKNNNLLFNPSTGNLQATQLNGVAIGTSPKFTDTTYNFAGSTFNSGSNGVAEHNANNIKTNGVYYYSSNGPSTAQMDFQTNDGGLYGEFYSTAWGGQIAQDYRTGKLAVRSLNNGAWQTWKQVMLFEDTLGLKYTANHFYFYPLDKKIIVSKSTSAWNSQCYSVNGYTDNACITFKPAQTNMAVFVGLSLAPESAPSTNPQNNINYAWYIQNSGNARPYESGTAKLSNIAYAAGDEFRIEYCGGYIRYYMNGSLKLSTAVTYDKANKFHLDIVAHGNATALYDVDFSQSAYHAAHAINSDKVNNLTVQTAVPANAKFTDANVAQTNLANTDTSARRILLSYSENNTGETKGSYKNAQLYFTPSTNTLVAGNFSGKLNNLSISLVT